MNAWNRTNFFSSFCAVKLKYRRKTLTLKREITLPYVYILRESPYKCHALRRQDQILSRKENNAEEDAFFSTAVRAKKENFTKTKKQSKFARECRRIEHSYLNSFVL